ncbi:MAG: serine/threonine-protein kinase [Polyangiaceae bacterium]|jgi:serine/threonine protein kinase
MARDPFGLTGQLIDGQFRVERAVGEGGFSVVYRGMHVGLSEPIAIKCLKLTATLEGESIEVFTRRFRDEGRLLYRLGQGNLDIVRCIMAGTTVAPTGALVPYMVLEWLDGCSLSVDLKARRDQKLRGRSLEELVAVFEPGALALDHAHRQGVVHRDVKPGNLFMATAQGRTRMKVLDFGLAKVLDETIGITQAATVGSFMMCSPRYAAPEQFDPKVGPVGPWTDVYSLALVLLEALRDEKVRKGDGLVGCMEEALTGKTDITAKGLGMHLPPRIDAALARAVLMDPKARWKTAGELWEEIKLGIREHASSARVPAQMMVPGGEPSTRSPASLAPDTEADPVFSVAPSSRDDVGGTVMMENAPRPPWAGGPSPFQPQAPSNRPPAGPLAAAMRAGLAPVPSQPPPPEVISAVTPRRRSGSGVVVTMLVLLVVAALGVGGFFAWRTYKTHAAWPGSTSQ